MNLIIRLGFENITENQDFFELGGDSLKAVSLSNVIESKTGIKIAVTEIFKHTTPKKMNAYIASLNGHSVHKNKIVPLKKAAYYNTSSGEAYDSLHLLDKTVPPIIFLQQKIE
ncbi:Hybrid non-ribosomal peptide synthetase/type I polyketide synthase OS=Lysinibacillus sphaericus OX=1421 GN=LS41612_16930 PE=3 SV=1 [Lysinibacillus sphaericus]